jgi:two-component system, cell cycle sensor histidine kinase and response regulator CckA
MPTLQALAPAGRIPAPVRGDPGRPALRFLIVEDSQDDVELIVSALHEGGHNPVWEQVQAADDLRLALAAQKWDVVSSAYSMPGFSGPEALEIVRLVDPELPFVVISERVDEDVAVAMMRAGANDYIRKHDIARLAPAVEREIKQAASRRAKRAAERAARQMAAIVESSNDAIISKTLDGVITTWNSAAEQLYGWTAAESIGRNVSFLVPPDKADELGKIMCRLEAGEHIGYFETVRLRRDGQRIDVAMTISPVRGADGRLVGISKTARDIRERKQAETALKQSEARYRGLIESIPALVWVYDSAGQPLLHNHRWYEYTGQTSEDIAANRWHEALHPDDEARAVAVWDRCSASGEPYSTEYRIRRKDGVYRWFLAQGAAQLGPTGIEQWGGICTDIDDRKRAEQSLQQTTGLLRAVADGTPDAVFVKDRMGRYVFFNRAAAQFVGRPASEVLGNDDTTLFGPADARILMDRDRRVIESGEAETEEEELTAAGATRTYLATKAPHRDSDGNIIGVIGVSCDITERKRAAETLTNSELRYRRLFEAAQDGVLIVDEVSRRVIDANPFLTKLLGYTRDELIGKELWEVGLFQDIDANKAAFLVLRERGYTRYDDLPLLTRDGRHIEVEFVSNSYDVGGARVIQCNIRDVSERKRAERRLATQHAIVEVLAQSPDLLEAAPKLMRAICETTGWDAGDFWTVDRHTNFLAYIDSWSVESVPAAFRDFSCHCKFAIGDCLPGIVWATGEPSWIVDVTKDPNFRRAEVARKTGLRGGFAFPVRFGDEILGVVEFFSRDSREPDGELLRMFESLGSQIGQFVERKRVEEGLRLFRALIDQTSDGIEVIDPETGRFLDVNEKSCVAHGYTRDEFLSLKVSDIDPQIGAKQWREVVRDRLLIDSPVFEGLHRRKDGSIFPVEVNLNAIRYDRDYMVAVVRDISDRKRSEESLRLRDRAIGEATQGILITDAVQPDNPIIYVSPGFERLTGYSSAEAVGRNCRFLQGEHTAADSIARLREAIRHGENCSVEVLNYRKDRTTFWNELSISPVRDVAGQLTHFVGVQSDVTVRRKLEEQFRQAQKMDAFGQLAGGVAHDFNNLLTIILGYSELLLQSLRREDPSRKLVAEIHKAGERSAGLTRQLLAFSRQQVLAPRVLNLNDVVAETDKMLRRLIGEDIRLTTTLSSKLWSVLVDPGQVEQVLLNLAVNARDAMPTGGQLTVETQNVDLDESYVQTHSGAHAGQHVLLSVTDTGIGMSPEVLSRIFEPFFTTKEPGKGTGLGLATVLGIVQQSGGHIAVYSEVGVGTTFKIYLAREEQDIEISTGTSSVLTPPRGTETVLLVEDEVGVRALTRLVLAEFGYMILEAADGNEANRVAAGHDGPIHLLISDVVMPGAGGRIVAENLMERHPELRVLFMSGYTDDAVIRHGVLREGVHFLQKPFTPLALALKVREVLDTPKSISRF